MRSFLFALFAVTVATTQVASAAATIPDYRARVNTGLAKPADDPRNAKASIAHERAKAPAVRFFATPARR